MDLWQCMLCVCVSVRPETSSCVVLEVELLVTEGSQMNISKGGKHHTYGGRETVRERENHIISKRQTT